MGQLLRLKGIDKSIGSIGANTYDIGDAAPFWTMRPNLNPTSSSYGEGSQVKVQTVTKALAAISKTLELAGQPSPVYREDQKYQVSIEKMIEGMRRADPLPRPQLAVPVKLVREASLIALQNDDPKHIALTDLMVIAFYYLLRSGEYTKPKFVVVNGKRRKASRTIQSGPPLCL